MNYHDPRRPRLASGLPSWLTSPLIALPPIVIHPLPDGKFRFAFMISNSFKYLITYRPETIINQWTYSPENFALTNFGIIPTASTSDIAVPSDPLDPASLGF